MCIQMQERDRLAICQRRFGQSLNGTTRDRMVPPIETGRAFFSRFSYKIQLFAEYNLHYHWRVAMAHRRYQRSLSPRDQSETPHVRAVAVRRRDAPRVGPNADPAQWCHCPMHAEHRPIQCLDRSTPHTAFERASGSPTNRGSPNALTQRSIGFLEKAKRIILSQSSEKRNNLAKRARRNW